MLVSGSVIRKTLDSSPADHFSQKRNAMTSCLRLDTTKILLEIGMFPPGECLQKIIHYFCLEPQTTVYKWLFQLDDEPNLYIGNGWKSPFPSIV